MSIKLDNFKYDKSHKMFFFCIKCSRLVKPFDSGLVFEWYTIAIQKWEINYVRPDRLVFPNSICVRLSNGPIFEWSEFRICIV